MKQAILVSLSVVFLLLAFYCMVKAIGIYLVKLKLNKMTDRQLIEAYHIESDKLAKRMIRSTLQSRASYLAR